MVVAIEVMADKEAWLSASPDLFALWRHTGMSIDAPVMYYGDSIGHLEPVCCLLSQKSTADEGKP